MSRGLTIAELVQNVLFLAYGVRLNVTDTSLGNIHAKSNKFQEIVMEANLVLEELQKEHDWSFLRDRWEMGFSNNRHGIQEFPIPDDIYKVCTGYNDAVRLHLLDGDNNPNHCLQIPFTEARSGNINSVDMFNYRGELDVIDNSQMAFVVSNTVTFKRLWHPGELHHLVETDVIRYIDPLHICDENCPDDCELTYKDKVLTFLPDPSYVALKTAQYRAGTDPTVYEKVPAIADRASKLLSAMRENDSAHTTVDSYSSSVLGFMPVY